MPLTPLQKEVIDLIAANRSVASHIAGGIALNAGPSTPRYSEDIDIFHDAEEAVTSASESDCKTLSDAGFQIVRQIWEPSYRRVWVERKGDGVKLEWAQDAAWRFFPIQADPVLKWRLHTFDALTNKALAMGSRSETRDMIDLVAHDGAYPLYAVIWAACAKDPGWTPLLLLEQMRRNARISPEAIAELKSSITALALKSKWLELAESSETKLAEAAKAGIEIGLAYLQDDASLAWHDTASAKPHRASLGGVVPRFCGIHYPASN